MKITLVARELIEERIIQARRAVADVSAILERIEKQRTELGQRARETEGAKSAAEAALKTLTMASVLNKGVPANIVKLKNEILAKTAESLRDDILVSEKARLDTEIRKLEAELQKQCAHPFVVQTRMPYTGSYSHDHEDQHKGNRVCAVCHFGEDSESSRDNTYKILTDAPERVIVWAALIEKTRLVESVRDGWYCVNTRLPVGEVIDCFTNEQMIKLLS
jgi:hypothetical protein